MTSGPATAGRQNQAGVPHHAPAAWQATSPVRMDVDAHRTVHGLPTRAGDLRSAPTQALSTGAYSGVRLARRPACSRQPGVSGRPAVPVAAVRLRAGPVHPCLATSAFPAAPPRAVSRPLPTGAEASTPPPRDLRHLRPDVAACRAYARGDSLLRVLLSSSRVLDGLGNTQATPVWLWATSGPFPGGPNGSHGRDERETQFRCSAQRGTGAGARASRESRPSSGLLARSPQENGVASDARDRSARGRPIDQPAPRGHRRAPVRMTTVVETARDHSAIITEAGPASAPKPQGARFEHADQCWL